MSSGSPYDTKEQVRAAVDIVDLVGGYLQLRRQGRNYVALCPWHDDRRPSLQVNPERQTWKCWVCDVGGDIFSFVMRQEGVEFQEALTILADRANVSIHPSSGNRAGSDEKKTLYEAMVWTENLYHEYLTRAPEAEPARRYLQERDISPQTVQRYRLGFSPDRWQWLNDRVNSSPFSTKNLESLGLLRVSDKSGRRYDFFRGRLMFPIRDVQNRTIAFGARVLPELGGDRGGKYINSPETRLFSKSDQLYGLNLARDSISRHKEAIVVEGYTDVLMSNQHGLDNVVAVLGTSLGSRHVQLLRRYADRVTLVLDGDEAGQRKANEILGLFVAEEVDLRILTLPDQMDPFDFLRVHGGEALRHQADRAVDALEHKIRMETRGLDPRRDLHRSSQALDRILETLSRAPRLQTTEAGDQGLRQQLLVPRLARDFAVPEKQIRDRLGTLRRIHSRHGTSSQEAETAVGPDTKRDAREVELLQILIQQPDAVRIASESIRPDQFAPGSLRDIYAAYCRLARSVADVSFANLLTELEDARLKNVLVELDDEREKKFGRVEENVDVLLKDLIEFFRRRMEDQAHQAKQAGLIDKSAVSDEREALMYESLAQRQQRQRLTD